MDVLKLPAKKYQNKHKIKGSSCELVTPKGTGLHTNKEISFRQSLLPFTGAFTINEFLILFKYIL